MVTVSVGACPKRPRVVQLPADPIGHPMLARIFRSFFWSHRAFLAWGIVFLIVIATWCVLHFRSIADFVDSRHERDAVRESNERLRRDIEMLERQQEELARGGFEIEKEARERLDLIKPGESVLRVSPPSSDDKVTTPTPSHR
jgi:cell division protein FtsB